MPREWSDNKPTRRLPDAKLVFCSKKGCGCHYLDRCPVHGPDPEDAEPEKSPVTERQWMGLY